MPFEMMDEILLRLADGNSSLGGARGKVVAGDEASYRYLAESIRMHPDQETLKTMMEQAGLDAVKYYNLSAGVVALHVGTKY